ncbi:UNVERIFIED_CONTAM: hypothetical protein Sangu_1916800 [Sesamum angustifolium]|uniref:Uncharacterized protein n=1 Tax=Sesamum angustifolium TaxID=2727405 RepID=A0AAW2LWZ2_9LAMI
MVPLLSQAAAGGGALLSATHHCSLKFAHPNPPLFSKRRPNFSLSRRHRPVTLANAADSSGGAATKPTASSSNVPSGDESSNSIAFVGQDNVPLEGVIQFEKPSSTSLLVKWGYYYGWTSCRRCGGVFLFSAIGRFSHGFPVFDLETLKTADPFIAGWFLSAYFLGGYGEDGRGNEWSVEGCYCSRQVLVFGYSVGINHKGCNNWTCATNQFHLSDNGQHRVADIISEKVVKFGSA